MRVLSSLLIGVSAVVFGACAENQGKSYWLRHANVTLSQAAEIAETNGPGRAVGAELGQSGNRVFVVNQDGDVWQSANTVATQLYSGTTRVPAPDAALAPDGRTIAAAKSLPATDGGAWELSGN